MNSFLLAASILVLPIVEEYSDFDNDLKMGRRTGYNWERDGRIDRIANLIGNVTEEQKAELSHAWDKRHESLDGVARRIYKREIWYNPSTWWSKDSPHYGNVWVTVHSQGYEWQTVLRRVLSEKQFRRMEVAKKEREVWERGVKIESALASFSGMLFLNRTQRSQFRNLIHEITYGPDHKTYKEQESIPMLGGTGMSIASVKEILTPYQMTSISAADYYLSNQMPSRGGQPRVAPRVVMGVSIQYWSKTIEVRLCHEGSGAWGKLKRGDEILMIDREPVEGGKDREIVWSHNRKPALEDRSAGEVIVVTVLGIDGVRRDEEIELKSSEDVFWYGRK